MMERKNCIVCDKRMNYIVTVRETGNQLQLHYCDMCKIGRSICEFSGAVYDDQYFYHYLRLSTQEFSHRLMNFRIDFILKAKPDCKTLMDYGTGSFAFINECINRKLSCVGYDVNPAVAHHIGPEYYKGLDHEGKYDCLSAFDVIEHLSSPGEWLETIKKWLNPGGVVVLSTPHYTDMPEGVFRSRHFKPKEHLFSFSRMGLDLLMDKHGYMRVAESEEPKRDNIALMGFKLRGI